jgi:23S rRNA (guanosine2251-2'-O)-methyltransferase
MSEDLTFGMHAVRHLLRAAPDRVRALYVQSGRKDEPMRNLLDLARTARTPIRVVQRDELDRMLPGARHQGAVARIAAASVLDDHALTSLIERCSEAPLLLVLDGVQDPHNLGAMLRLADAAGVHAVVAPRDRAVGLTPAVRKVASGAAETVSFAQVSNLARCLARMPDLGVRVIGTALDATASLYEEDLTGPTALVLGGEAAGLRRLTRERCDRLVSLPMRGSIESMNVAVTAGICVYEAVRQRGLAPSPGPPSR